MAKYGQYGAVAVEAAKIIKQGTGAESAWRMAATKLIESKSSRDKGCPKNAFLGIFANSDGTNALYAKKAVRKLREDPHKDYTANELWAAIGQSGKSHNGQMDVVLALWEEGLLP
jgi:hypothetical protein